MTADAHMEHYKDVCAPQFSKLFDGQAAASEATVEILATLTAVNQNLTRLTKILDGNGTPPLQVEMDRFRRHLNDAEARSDNIRGGLRSIVIAVVVAVLISLGTTTYSMFQAYRTSILLQAMSATSQHTNVIAGDTQDKNAADRPDAAQTR